jgi:hypothetical protein
VTRDSVVSGIPVAVENCVRCFEITPGIFESVFTSCTAAAAVLSVSYSGLARMRGKTVVVV